MTVIEFSSAPSHLTQRQRWSHYLTIAYALIALFIAINLRDNALYAKTPYSNAQVGIRAEYPRNWLLDTTGDYVFRVRDTAHSGFKTTIQVAVRPVSAGVTQTRNVLDALSLSRLPTLSTYNILSVEPYTFPDGTAGSAMSYTFVATSADPFLQPIPSVVQGRDLITIKRGQAIIISFLSDAQLYDENFPVFEQFLNSLEF